jgi:hypothetical protein
VAEARAVFHTYTPTVGVIAVKDAVKYEVILGNKLNVIESTVRKVVQQIEESTNKSDGRTLTFAPLASRRWSVHPLVVPGKTLSANHAFSLDPAFVQQRKEAGNCRISELV